MKPIARLLFALESLLLCPIPASASLVLEFGEVHTLTRVSHFVLQPNEVRDIALLVHNDGAGPVGLSGYSLELSLGDGGPQLGGPVGPGFTGVDLVTDTPFALDHGTPSVVGGPNPVSGLGSVPQFLGLSLTTVSTDLAPHALGVIQLAPGRTLLGTLTISAAGFTTAHSWDLAFLGPGSASFFNDGLNDELMPDLAQSTLSVVPEPRACAIATGLGLLGLALARAAGTARTRGTGNARRRKDAIDSPTCLPSA